LIETKRVWRSWEGSVGSDGGGLAPPWRLDHSFKLGKDGPLPGYRTSVGGRDPEGVETEGLVLIKVGHGNKT
jgi:hypothetical protein